MAQLTYWSLENYSHIPIVAQAKAALAKQMTAMEQHIWELTGHVCENFNPHKYVDVLDGWATPRKNN
jgi:Tfp pilus assembly protein PilE